MFFVCFFVLFLSLKHMKVNECKRDEVQKRQISYKKSHLSGETLQTLYEQINQWLQVNIFAINLKADAKLIVMKCSNTKTTNSIKSKNGVKTFS